MCEQDWEEFWASIRPVELSGRVQRVAGRLVKRHRLRGADAVHLASALDIDATLSSWRCGIAASMLVPRKRTSPTPQRTREADSTGGHRQNWLLIATGGRSEAARLEYAGSLPVALAEQGHRRSARTGVAIGKRAARRLRTGRHRLDRPA